MPARPSRWCPDRILSAGLTPASPIAWSVTFVGRALLHHLGWRNTQEVARTRCQGKGVSSGPWPSGRVIRVPCGHNSGRAECPEFRAAGFPRIARLRPARSLSCERKWLPTAVRNVSTDGTRAPSNDFRPGKRVSNCQMSSRAGRSRHVRLSAVCRPGTACRCAHPSPSSRMGSAAKGPCVCNSG